MTPQKQLLKHDPANGIWGDCGRAALASILDLPILSVPHFFDGGDAEKGCAARDAWLLERNLVNIAVPMDPRASLAEVLVLTSGHNSHTPMLLVGESPRGPWGHIVVAQAGEVIHDPAITPCEGDKLVGPEPVTGYWWIEIIGARLG